MNKSKIKHKPSIILIATQVILVLYAISLLTMLLWGFYNSFKDYIEYDDSALALPKKWLFDNVLVAISRMKVEIDVINGPVATRFVSAPEMFYNTILYAVGGGFVVTFFPCVVAYVVSKYSKNFKCLGVYTSIVIICMSIPIVGSQASELAIANKLNMIDQIWGLWVLKAYFLGMYYLVFLASFKSIPDSFSEAAKIDGASNFQILSHIMFPLVKTTFTTIFLIKFIELWNDYQTPLLFMPNRPTISYGLYRFGNSTDPTVATVPMQMMGSMIVFIPILVVFSIFQKRIMGNISMGGLKE